MNHPPQIKDPNLKKAWDDWLQRQWGTSSSEGSPTVKKQRCLNIGGKDILCIQDKAEFKLTPGMAVAGSLILYLLMRR